MKTSEFKEKVESIGYKLARGKDDWVITISGDAIGTATVSTKDTAYCISSLPFRVATIVAEFANTPVENRKDEKRWNVVIGEDVDYGKRLSIWRRQDYDPDGSGSSYIDDDTDLSDLKEPFAIYTDSEFARLIKQIKLLPYGETYAKIAELGKREVTKPVF